MQNKERISKLKKRSERIDDLMNGYFVLQDPKGFCFGVDAVLLSHFPKLRRKEVALDIGTGCGIIPILMEARAKAAGYHLEFTAVEIDPGAADLARRSVEGNGLEEEVSVLNADIKEISKYLNRGQYSLITCNPPYFTADQGAMSDDERIAAARHETKMNLKDIMSAAEYLLKPKGKICMIHRPERMPEVMETMMSCGLSPRRIRTIHPFADKDAVLFLIEGQKGTLPDLKIERPLVVYESKGVYTKETKAIYGVE